MGKLKIVFQNLILYLVGFETNYIKMTKKNRKALIDNGNKIVIDFIFVCVSNLLQTGNYLSLQ